MDAPLGFGVRDPLYTVGPRFELQSGIDAGPADPADDLFVSSLFPGAFADGLRYPALQFGKAQIHTVEVAGKQRCLGAAGARPYLQKDVSLIIGARRYQQQFELGFQVPLQLPGLFQFIPCQFRHLLVLQHFPGAGDRLFGALVAPEAIDHRVEPGILLAQTAILVLISLNLRVASRAVISSNRSVIRSSLLRMDGFIYRRRNPGSGTGYWPPPTVPSGLRIQPA